MKINELNETMGKKRKSRITKTRFIEAAKGSAGVQAVIAQSLKVTRSAVCQFVQKNPDMRELLEEEEEKLIDMAENQLHQKVQGGDWKAIEKVLNSKGAKRGWADTQNQNINQTFGEKLEIEIVEGSKPDESTKP